MRRFSGCLLSIAIVINCVFCNGICSYADGNPEILELNGSSEYIEYCKSNQKFSNASVEIILPSESAKLNGGAISENGGISLTEKGDSVAWEFNVEEDKWFEPVVFYKAIAGNGNDIEISFLIDGNVPYPELENVLLPRLWKNAVTDFEEDEEGNQYIPEQIEVFEEQKQNLLDDEGFCTENLKIALKKGQHTIEIVLNSEKIFIEQVILGKITDNYTYENYKTEFVGKNYSGDYIIYEGEKAEYKSQKSFIPLTNRNDVVISPSNPFIKKINYIGGSNWNRIGGTITWKVNVPMDAFYGLNFHFRQNYLQESNSYRTLLVDGQIPFDEAKAIPFGYKSGWQLKSLNDTPIYLTKGEHTISLRVTLGELSSFAHGLSDIANRMGKIYRQIVRITGESPDANRDYDLFIAIPDLEENLNDISKELEKLAEESERIVGSKGGSNAQTLRKAKITIDKMLEVKYEAHKKLSSFHDNYSSLSSWLYEMQSMALDIDSMALGNPESNGKYIDVSFLEKVGFSVKRLLATFINDYENNTAADETLVLWSNWGRDQINVLQNLIDNDFTPKHNIKVNVKITTASLIEAGLSGNGPDVELNSVSSNILNYAMRGVLYDLSQFKDFDDVCTLFSKTATVPYQYKGGVYGLPNTENFNMLFVRTDIFDELGLGIPTTWAEFIDCAKVINLNNMNCGMGGNAYMFMTQTGTPIYAEDRLSTNLISKDAVKAFTTWTDFYTKYNFPKTYDFFNRFRIGLMPMGIAPYSTNATIKAAAPEINGKWRMYQVPGTVSEDGTVNNSINATGTASMILKWSEHKENAWEFLKWWCSEDIQYRFGINIESVLGVSGRYCSATLNAVYRLGWESSDLEAIKSSFETLQNIPQVPGSYYVDRSIQQVYWNVVNLGEDVEDMLNEWIPEADDEIKRKTNEYYNMKF